MTWKTERCTGRVGRRPAGRVARLPWTNKPRCDRPRVTSLQEETMREIGHFIGGAHVAGVSGNTGPVFNPASGEITGRVAMANAAEVDKAVAAAAAAWPAWANTP